jgi:hypothetical protein
MSCQNISINHIDKKWKEFRNTMQQELFIDFLLFCVTVWMSCQNISINHIDKKNGRSAGMQQQLFLIEFCCFKFFNLFVCVKMSCQKILINHIDKNGRNANATRIIF